MAAHLSYRISHNIPLTSHHLCTPAFLLLFQLLHHPSIYLWTPARYLLITLQFLCVSYLQGVTSLEPECQMLKPLTHRMWFAHRISAHRFEADGCLLADIPVSGSLGNCLMLMVTSIPLSHWLVFSIIYLEVKKSFSVVSTVSRHHITANHFQCVTGLSFCCNNYDIKSYKTTWQSNFGLSQSATDYLKFCFKRD